MFQWLFDEAQMNVDNVGAPVTKQQWDYIHKMGDSLRKSFRNVSAVFAPSCISHSMLTKREWRNVKIDGISIADALHCWEQSPFRRNMRRIKNSAMVNDDPMLGARQVKRMHATRERQEGNNFSSMKRLPNFTRNRGNNRGNMKPKGNRKNRNCKFRTRSRQSKL